EHSSRFVRGEDSRLAKHIAINRQIFGDNGREHFGNYQIQIVLPCAVRSRASVLVGNFVSSKKGRDEIKWSLFIEPPDHSKNLELVFEAQSVTTLGLDCGCAVIEKPLSSRFRRFE